MKALSIVLVDDHAPTRRAIEALINEQADLQTIGQAASGAEGVDLARRLRPDIIIMDIMMPGMNGIDATKAIQKETPGACVLTLSNHTAPGFVNAMLEAGAAGYVRKDEASAELVEALRSVASGVRYLGSRLGD